MCGCKNNIEKNCGCRPAPRCDCKVLIDSECVNSVSAEFSCLPINSGQSLNETLEAMDAGICQIIEDNQLSTTLVNVGAGAGIYKGVNAQSQREIKSLVEGTLIDITSQENTITVAVDTTALQAFVNPRTYSVQNTAGSGAGVYKDSIVVGTNTQFNLKKIQSPTLSITETADAIIINNPETQSIPALYVNNLYVPSYADWLAGNGKGIGTLAKPYTDTIVYTNTTTSFITPNTAIQNALDAYVGSGTRLSPQLAGQQAIVQNNNSSYTFPGILSYAQLDLKIEGNVISTNTGYILDMEDTAGFNATSASAAITVEEGASLEIRGLGFRNNGNSQAGQTFQTAKIIRLLGQGTISSAVNNIARYIINSDTANTGTNNDGNVTFQIMCKLFASQQGVYHVGGNSRIDIFNDITSGEFTTTVNPSLKAFHQTGGQVRQFSAMIGFAGGTRTDVITFTPTGFTPAFIATNSVFQGSATNLFTKTNASDVIFEVTNSASGYGLTITNIFQSPNIWQVLFKGNTFGSGSIDITKADLTKANTVSSVNTIGNNVIEILVRYTNRTAANLALPPYSVFINTKDNAITNFATSASWLRDITLPTS